MAGGATPSRRAAPAPELRGRLRGRAPAGGGQARRGRDPSRRPATAGRRWPRRCAGRAAGGADPRARGHRPPPRPRHLGPAGGGQDRGGLRGAPGADEARARSTPRVPGARRAATPTPRAARSTRRSGRDRARPHGGVHAQRPRRATRVTHFEVLERLPRTTLLRVRLETGPHAPDPRAPGRDRPSGLRRPPLRGRAVRPRGSAWSANSSTRTKLMFRHPVTRGTRASASPNHPLTCVARSTQRDGSQSPEGQTGAET